MTLQVDEDLDAVVMLVRVGERWYTVDVGSGNAGTQWMLAQVFSTLMGVGRGMISCRHGNNVMLVHYTFIIAWYVIYAALITCGFVFCYSLLCYTSCCSHLNMALRSKK